MKNKQSFFMSALALLFILSGCTEEKKNISAPAGMHVLDLTRYGKPFAIFVPDTSKTSPQITEQSSGSLDIRVGPSFAISINEQAADLDLKRSDVKDDEVNRLDKFLVDEPDGIVWRSAITKPEHHFAINKKINGSDYSFEDVRDNEHEPFTEEQVMKMYESSRNIEPMSPTKE